MISGRALAASAVIPSVGFVVTGGRDGNGNILDTTEVLDDDWNVVSGTHGPTHQHCAVTFQGRSLLVTGGIVDRKRTDQALMITLETDHGYTSTVTALPSMNHARARHGCAAADLSTGLVYVVAGGYRAKGEVLDTVEMFTFEDKPEEGSWEFLGSLLQPRYSLTVVSSFGQLIIAGGRSDTEKEEYPALPVLKYVWEEASWVQWEEFSTTRTSHVTLVMDKVVEKGWVLS